MTKFLRVFKSVASEFGLGQKIILVFQSGCLLFHHKLKTLFTINCLWLKYDSCQKLEQSNRFPTAVKEFSIQNKRKRTFCTTTTMAARNTLKILPQIFYKHLARNFTRTSSSLAIVQERSGRHQFSHNLISRSCFSLIIKFSIFIFAPKTEHIITDLWHRLWFAPFKIQLGLTTLAPGQCTYYWTQF